MQWWSDGMRRVPAGEIHLVHKSSIGVRGCLGMGTLAWLCSADPPALDGVIVIEAIATSGRIAGTTNVPATFTFTVNNEAPPDGDRPN